jgi:hypothetical protein
VASDYAGGAAVQREAAWDVPYSNNSYPIRLQIAQSDWVKLLDEMKFTHILLHEFPAPAFHPYLRGRQSIGEKPGTITERTNRIAR